MIHLGEEIQHLLFYVAHIHLADTMEKGFAGFPYPNYLVAHSIELDSLQLLHQTVSPSCFSKKEKKKKSRRSTTLFFSFSAPSWASKPNKEEEAEKERQKHVFQEQNTINSNGIVESVSVPGCASLFFPPTPLFPPTLRHPLWETISSLSLGSATETRLNCPAMARLIEASKGGTRGKGRRVRPAKPPSRLPLHKLYIGLGNPV